MKGLTSTDASSSCARVAGVDAKITIPDAVIARISTQASTESPLECCGMLVGKLVAGGFEVTRSIATRNISSGDTRRTYQIDWSPLLQAARRSRTTSETLLGFYHSHPDGSSIPSQADRASAWVGVAYLILPIVRMRVGKAAAWWVRDNIMAFEPLRLRLPA